MSIDGFLTFLGFLAASIAVLKPIQQRRIALHVTRHYIFSAFMGGIILLLFFFEPLYPHLPSGLSVSLSWIGDQGAPLYIGPNRTAFLVLVAWFAGTVFMARKAQPNAAALGKLHVLVERLFDESRYLEVAEIIRPYLAVIQRASDRKLPIQRLHYRIRGPRSFAETLLEARLKQRRPKKSIFWEGFQRKVRGGLSALVPARTAATETADRLQGTLLRSTGFADTLMTTYPDLIYPMICSNRGSAEVFRDRLMKGMLVNPASHLHQEIDNAVTSSIYSGFSPGVEAVFLKALFGDASNAEKLSIWKPVGDEAIRLIYEDPHYGARLVAPKPVLGSSIELLGDPVNLAVRFFDLMVIAAAHQGVKYHMWLMYMPLITEALIDLHRKADAELDGDEEFPSLGCYLIYEITSTQADWVRMAQHLSKDNFHVSPEMLAGGQNASIPSSAALSQARCIRKIVAEQNLPERFRVDRWEGYLSLINSIPNTGHLAALRQKLITEAVAPTIYTSDGDLKAKLSAIHQKVDAWERSKSPEVTALLSSD